MGKEIVNQVQEAQRVPGRINPRRNTPRHMVIKLTKMKDRDKILRTTCEKQQITYKRTPIRLSADFSTETLQARRECQDVFEVMKGKNLQPRIFYLQIWWRNQNLSRQAKVKRIQHYQTSITTNAKATILGRKHKRREGPYLYKINPRQLRKW